MVESSWGGGSDGVGAGVVLLRAITPAAAKARADPIMDRKNDHCNEIVIPSLNIPRKTSEPINPNKPVDRKTKQISQ